MATTIDDIRDLLGRDPFQPFRIRLTSGDYYDIRDPFSVAMMTTRLFVAVTKAERSVYVPYVHIAALETLTNGSRGQPARRRRAAR